MIKNESSIHLNKLSHNNSNNNQIKQMDDNAIIHKGVLFFFKYSSLCFVIGEENISISDSEPLAPAILLDVSLNEQKQLLGELSFVLV
ncbi:unnamed protein product [Rotaria sp. Silwood1]|nr:unnamed protein product [Rotaria sp. Silwood1]CAF1625735.1 unnamed protein product [Rotaria sp. Silwood1]CAF3756982.1 unnamed protein product [Rotaria sp. Silwood1]